MQTPSSSAQGPRGNDTVLSPNLVGVVEESRLDGHFGEVLKELSFFELQGIDNYLQIFGTVDEDGSVDHRLWKELRDAMATHLVDKGEEIRGIAETVGEPSKELVEKMSRTVRNQVQQVLNS